MRKTKKDLIKVAILNKRLGHKSYKKLFRIALEESFNLEAALRSAPIYWRNLQLDNYTSEIQKVLKTSAQPNTKEFLQAVYEYQKAHPETGTADAMLGPQTFRAIVKLNPELFKNTDPTQYEKWLSPKQKVFELLEDQKGKSVDQLVKEYGLVSLEGLVPIKNSPFIKPELKALLEKLIYNGAEIKRVTEAFPPSSKHRTPGHHNGGAMDFTLTDPQSAALVVNYISKLPQFKVLNEYDNNYGGKGGHIHVHLSGAKIG